MKILSKFPIIIVALIIIFSILSVSMKQSREKYQKMNELDYSVSLNEDGSINVIETWDIYVKNTGTLFRTFDNSGKYPISDVNVIDLTENKNLNNMNRYTYDVPEGNYYGTKRGYNQFEIAWGTGKKSSKGNVKYQISYKVDNVITSYNDCQEFYWKFLDSSNDIACEKITGTIKLYKPVSNIENLRVWGHGEINGTIERASEDTIKFDINNFNARTMLEIRSIVTEKIFNTSRINSRNALNDILEEEKYLADKTNEEIASNRRLIIGILIVEGIFLLYGLVKIIIKIINKDSGEFNYKGIEYYRDIPRENNSTPGEAIYLYNMFTYKNNNKSLIAAYILDLCVKGYLSIQEENKDMYITILKQPEGLKEDEKAVYDLIRQVAMGNNKVNIKDINKFSKKDKLSYEVCTKSIMDNIEHNLRKENLIERDMESLKRSEKREHVLTIAMVISLITSFALNITSILLFIPVVLFIIELIVLYNLRLKLNKYYKLTQNGVYEAEEWNGLRNYLKDYSLLEEKNVFDINLWEKYLVYATALGISKELINQLREKYPDLFTEKYWSNNENTSTILNIACNPIYINNSCDFRSFTNGMTTHNISIRRFSVTYSSSSGGGGGFSSGGGGRRWPVAGMGGR